MAAAFRPFEGLDGWMSDGSTRSEKVEFAIERLLETPDGWRPLVRDMVARWPEAPAAELVYVLVSAATEIEATFADGSPSRAAADHAWRLAALLGVDFYAMEAVGLPRTKAADLAGYWLIDPYFRNL
ncbi:hypothetical protein DEA8626_03559 [Defluviimonas aquaemixtae]|uniref:Uncharacterized protein n=1 Tax=Albidovulum aquaemixtae TaxID=1542388 RepID=A0A2R8BM64_9RHOB|nr:hypothetical protein DEA8626_03559 [Defluviimonas aquaemixtae]